MDGMGYIHSTTCFNLEMICLLDKFVRPLVGEMNFKQIGAILQYCIIQPLYYVYFMHMLL